MWNPASRVPTKDIIPPFHFTYEAPMKRLLPIALAALFVATGCGSDKSGGDNGNSKKPVAKKVAKKPAAKKKKNPNQTENVPQTVVARIQDGNLQQSGQESFKHIEFRTVVANSKIDNGQQAEANFNAGRKVSMETNDENNTYGLTTRVRHYWHFPVLRAIGSGVYNVGAWMLGYQPRYFHNSQWHAYDNGRSHNHKGYRYYVYRSNKVKCNPNNGGFNGGSHHNNQPGQKYYPNQGKSHTKYVPRQGTTKHYPKQGQTHTHNHNHNQRRGIFGWWGLTDNNSNDTYYGRDTSGRDVFIDSNGRKFRKNNNGSRDYNVNQSQVNRDANYGQNTQNNWQTNNRQNQQECR